MKSLAPIGNNFEMPGGYGGAEMQIFKTRFLIIQMQKARSEKLARANFNGKRSSIWKKAAFRPNLWGSRSLALAFKSFHHAE